MKWSDVEVEYLINNFQFTTDKNLSIYLNRSLKSISKKAYSLKLRKSKEHISKLMIKNNKNRTRDLSYELLKTISSNYKTRGEFQCKDSSAYFAARNSGMLDELCKHMIPQSYSIPQLILREILSNIIDSPHAYNTRKIITPYEIDIYFPAYKLAFEYNGKGWHTNNINDHKKKDKLKKYNIKLVSIVENNRRYEEDVKSQIIQNLNIINKITNKNITPEEVNSINIENIFNHLVDDTKIKETLFKYKTYKDFRINEVSLYKKLHRLKLLKHYYSVFNLENPYKS